MASYEIPNASDGSIIADLVLNYEDSLKVKAGGSATGTTVNAGGEMSVEDEGWANNTTVNEGGSMSVYDNGLAGQTILNPGGCLAVFSGGKVIDLTMDEYSDLVMKEETTLQGATINGGRATMSGTEVSGMTVASGARVDHSAGTGDSVLIGASCTYVGGYGVAMTNVNMSGGFLILNSGTLGTATISDDPAAGYGAGIGSHASAHMAGGEVTSATLSGYVTLTLGEAANTHAKAHANHTVLLDSPTGGDNVPVLQVSSGCMANDTTIGSNCMMILEDTAAADIVKIASGGTLKLADNATVTNISCEKGGYMLFNLTQGTNLEGTSAGTPFKVEDGALSGISTLECMRFWFGGSTLNDISIQSGATVRVDNGGVLGLTNPDSCTLVGVGGELIVENGGTAQRIREDGGYVYANSNANVTFLPTEFNNLALTSDMRATIHSGTATSTTISGMENVSSATLFVMEGGSAYDTHVMSNGGMAVSSGGAAFRTQIDGGGVNVNSGGSASGTTVNGGGFAVNNGGVAYDTTVSGGHLNVAGGVVSGGTVNDGYFNVYYSGSAYDIVLNRGGTADDGYFSVNYGGSAVRTIVNFGAVLSASEGSYLSGTVVNSGGELRILSQNATIADTTVAQDGRLEIASGGTLKGDVTFADGAQIEFDLTGLYPGTHIMVEDLADIHGNPDYRIGLIPDTMPFGSYTIASGATGFHDTLTVVNAVLETELGTLTVGSSLEIGEGVFCSLTVEDDDLVLTVGDVPIVHDNGPDSGWNNYVYDKKNKDNPLNPQLGEFVENKLAKGAAEVRLDRINSVDLDGKHNFVGRVAGAEPEQDAADYAKIVLSTGAKLTFDIASLAGGKFVIYRLVTGTDKKGNPTYSMKSLQSTSLKKSKGATEFTASSKEKLFEAGTYYVAMQGTIAKKGDTTGFYNVNVGAKTVYFEDDDDGWNNYAYDKKAVPEDNRANLFLRNINSVGQTIQMDKTSYAAGGNFVGYGDDTDFVKIHLNTAANLSFGVKASGASDVKNTGALKLVIYSFDEEKKKLTALHTTSFKTAAGAVDATSKLRLLEVGDYYVSVQASNASKGDAVYYDLSVGSDTVFFTGCDDGWNDYVYDKKNEAHPLNTAVTEAAGFVVKADAKGNPIALDNASYTFKGRSYGNFVGHGDDVDFVKITVSKVGSASFKVEATDAAKIEIWQLASKTDKKGVTTYSMKSLQSTALKKTEVIGGVQMYGIETKAYNFKEPGEYYLSVTSTNAKTGGNAYYNVSLLDTDITADAVDADALAMPELSDGGLNLTDALSFGQLGADALADASAASLAELDGKSGWQDLLLA